MTHEQTETVWQTRAFQSSASPIRASAGAGRSGAQGRSLLRPRYRQAGDGDIAICGDRIVGTYADYRGLQEIDISGRIVVPVFIGPHLHIEFSRVTPHDRRVLPCGVTTAICDPHEIANVLGLEGITYFLDSVAETAMDIRVQLSSCAGNAS